MTEPETRTCPECDDVPNAWCECCEGDGIICVECEQPPTCCECREEEGE
jgi:hypothetical protein